MICPRCHRAYPASQARCRYDGAALSPERRLELLSVRPSRKAGVVLDGRYRIHGYVGRGGTARVYVAEDLTNGEPVAVKLLEPPWSENRVARERFLRQAQAALAIRHPGVVRVDHVGEHPEAGPFLVMEHLFGETLGAYLAREGAMGLDIALPVLDAVASALEAAHEAGVLHRDVKPDNVFLIGEPGEPYGVRVVDFGLAKLRDAAITAAGTAIGTAAFMSPEQCVTDEPDPRSDVYGLGMVMYLALTGSGPYGPLEAAEDHLAHNLLRAPRRPTVHGMPLPDAVTAVVARCLHKDPANRYASLGALRADLAALLADREPAALRMGPPDHDEYVPQTQFAVTVARALQERLTRARATGTTG